MREMQEAAPLSTQQIRQLGDIRRDRRASSLESNFAADLRPGSFSK
jgi:hypothetical protein